MGRGHRRRRFGVTTSTLLSSYAIATSARQVDGAETTESRLWVGSVIGSYYPGWVIDTAATKARFRRLRRSLENVIDVFGPRVRPMRPGAAAYWRCRR